ncbi:MAG: hypothetical protein ABIH74_02815 [Candidatus Omnitrophota bacterium]
MEALYLTHGRAGKLDLRKSRCYNEATRNEVKTAGAREVAQLG